MNYGLRNVTNTTETRRARRSRWLLLAMLIGCTGLAGCGKPGDIAQNYTNCWVTVTLNGNEPLQSDVLSDGYALDDVVTVKLKSVFRALSDDDPTVPNGPSPFDTIVFHSYLVTHRRSDGGPNPASFTGGVSLALEPDSESEMSIVVVRAFDKHRSPLAELRDDGEIFTTSIIVFYGTDGNGNDIEVSGSLTISYANLVDT